MQVFHRPPADGAADLGTWGGVLDHLKFMDAIDGSGLAKDQRNLTAPFLTS
jgi:hypothetical protein